MCARLDELHCIITLPPGLVATQVGTEASPAPSAFNRVADRRECGYGSIGTGIFQCANQGSETGVRDQFSRILRCYCALTPVFRVAALVDGAAVVEEITAVLNRLADEIITLQQRHEALEVFCIYHGSEDKVVMQRLLPPFAGLAHQPQSFPHPPLLNLTPATLLAALTDQYLFAALHAMLYTSLMMENHHRITHLDGAVKHLDEQSKDLARQCNALRQEEIIEEIEVILLSAASLGE
jgi:hypothetical protein